LLKTRPVNFGIENLEARILLSAAPYELSAVENEIEAEPSQSFWLHAVGEVGQGGLFLDENPSDDLFSEGTDLAFAVSSSSPGVKADRQAAVVPEEANAADSDEGSEKTEVISVGLEEVEDSIGEAVDQASGREGSAPDEGSIEGIPSIFVMAGPADPLVEFETNSTGDLNLIAIIESELEKALEGGYTLQFQENLTLGGIFTLETASISFSADLSLSEGLWSGTISIQSPQLSFALGSLVSATVTPSELGGNALEATYTLNANSPGEGTFVLNLGETVFSVDQILTGAAQNFSLGFSPTTGLERAEVALTDVVLELTAGNEEFMKLSGNGIFLLTDDGIAADILLSLDSEFSFGVVTLEEGSSFRLRLNTTEEAITSIAGVEVNLGEGRYIRLAVGGGILVAGNLIRGEELFFEQKSDGDIAVGGTDLSFLLQAGTGETAKRIVELSNASFFFSFSATGFFGVMRNATVTGPDFDELELVGIFSFDLNTTGVEQLVTVGTAHPDDPGLTIQEEISLGDGDGDILLQIAVASALLRVGNSRLKADRLLLEKDGSRVTVGGEKLSFTLNAGETRIVGVTDADFTFAFDQNGFYGAMRNAEVTGPDLDGFALLGVVSVELNTTRQEQTVTVGDTQVSLGDGDGALYLRVEISGAGAETPATFSVADLFTATSQLLAFELNGSDVTLEIKDLTLAFGSSANPLLEVTGSATFQFTPTQILIPTSSLTFNGTYSVGSFLAIESPGISLDNFEFLHAGAGSPELLSATVGISATSATLFPDQAESPITFLAEQVSGSLDLITASFSIGIGVFQLDVLDAFMVDAEDLVLAYDPAEEGSQELVKIGNGQITFTPLNFRGEVSDLSIRTDGFSFGVLTIENTGTYNLGSVLRFSGVGLEINNFSVTFGETFVFAGSMTLFTGGATLFPGSSIFTASIASEEPGARAASATLNFNQNGSIQSLVFLVSSFSLKISDYLTLTAKDFTLDTGAATDEHLVEFGEIDAILSIPQVGFTIGGGGQNFAITGGGAFVPLTDFGVSFSFGIAEAGGLDLPDWLPLGEIDLAIQWQDFTNAPQIFRLALSVAVSGRIPGTDVSLEGFIQDLVIDIGLLVDGKFPVVSFGAVGVQAGGTLAGFALGGGFFIGLLELDSENRLVGEDPAAGEIASRVLYGGITGTLVIAGYGGFAFRLGLSQYGPLQGYLKAVIPVPVGGPTGFAITGFRGGITFNAPLPDGITDPRDLANDPGFQTSDDLSLDEWKSRVAQGVQGQMLILDELENLISGGFNPLSVLDLSFRVEGGGSVVNLFAAYAFAISGDIILSSDGKLFVTGDLSIADAITVKGSLFLDVSGLLSLDLLDDFTPSLTALILVEIPAEEKVVQVYGGITFRYGDTSFDPNQVDLSSLTEIRDYSGFDVVDESNTFAGINLATPFDFGLQDLSLNMIGGLEISLVDLVTLTVEGEVDLVYSIGDNSLALDIVGTVDLQPFGLGLGLAGRLQVEYAPDDAALVQLPDVWGVFALKPAEFGLFETLGIEADAIAVLRLNATNEEKEESLQIPGQTGPTEFTLASASVGVLVEGKLGFAFGGTNLLQLQGSFGMTWSSPYDEAAGFSPTLDVFVQTSARLGLENAPLLSGSAVGYLQLSLDGIAALIDLEIPSPQYLLDAGITSEASYRLAINTRGEDFTYLIPTEFPEIEAEPGFNEGGRSVTLARAPPNPDGSIPEEGRPYFLIDAKGSFTILDAFILEGESRLLFDSDGIDFVFGGEFSFQVGSVLIYQFTATGGFRLSDDGLAVGVQLTAGSTIEALGFKLEGEFLLEANTTGEAVTIGGVTLAGGVGPYVRVTQTGVLESGGIRLDGTHRFESLPNRLEVSTVASVTLGAGVGEATWSLFEFDAAGSLVIDETGIAGIVALAVSADSLSPSWLSFEGDFSIGLNTTPEEFEGIPAFFGGAIRGNGTLTILDEIDLLGSFDFILSPTLLVLRGDASIQLRLGDDVLLGFRTDFRLELDLPNIVEEIALSIATPADAEKYGISLDATFLLQINTSGQEVGNLEAGIYTRVFADGTLVLLDSLTLEGEFFFEATTNGFEIRSDFTTTLAVGGQDLFTFTGQGRFALNVFGVAGSVSLSLTSDGDSSGDFGFSMNAEATYHLVFNSRLTEAVIGDVTIGAGPFIRVTADGEMGLGGFALAGSFSMEIRPASIEVAVSSTLELRMEEQLLLEFGAVGGLILDLNGIAGVIVLSVESDLTDSFGFSLDAIYQLEVNASLGVPARTFNGYELVAGEPVLSANLVLDSGPYQRVTAFGKLGVDGLTLSGTYQFKVVPLGFAVATLGDLTVELGDNTLFSFTVSGDIDLSRRGLAGVLSLGLTSTATVGSDFGFSLAGTYQLEINLTGGTPDRTFLGYDFGPLGEAGPITDITLDDGMYARITMGGALVVGGFSMQGRYSYTLRQGSVRVAVTSFLQVGVGGTDLFSFSAIGGIEVRANGIAGILQLDLQTQVTGSFGFGFVGSYQLEINMTPGVVSFDGFRVDEATGNIEAEAIDLPGGPHLVLRMGGTLTVDSLTFRGGFALEVSADQALFGVSASADLGLLGTPAASGTILLVNGGGMAGQLTITPDLTALEAVGLRLTAGSGLWVEINTTGSSISRSDGIVVFELDEGNYARLRLVGGVAFDVLGEEFFRIQGSIVIEIDEEEALFLGAADLLIVKPGTDDVFLSFAASIFLVLRSSGVVGQASVSIEADPLKEIADVDFSFGGDFEVTFNTTREEYSRVAPEGMKFPDGSEELSLPNAPGGKPLFGGFGEDVGRVYALFSGSGFIDLLGFRLEGSFAYEVAIEGILFYIPDLKIEIPSPVDEQPLLSFISGGAFMLGFDGIAGRFDLTLVTNFPEWSQLSVDANFELHINTRGRDFFLELPTFVERPAWLPETFFISGAPDGYGHFRFETSDEGVVAANLRQINPATGLVLEDTSIQVVAPGGLEGIGDARIILVDNVVRGGEFASFDPVENSLRVHIQAGSEGSTALDILAAINDEGTFIATLDASEDTTNNGTGASFSATGPSVAYARVLADGELNAFGFRVLGQFGFEVSETSFAIGVRGLFELSVPFTDVVLIRHEVVGVLAILEDGVAGLLEQRVREGFSGDDVEFLPGILIGNEYEFTVEINTTGREIASLVGIEVNLPAPAPKSSFGFVSPLGVNNNLRLDALEAGVGFNGLSLNLVDGAEAGQEIVSYNADLNILTVVIAAGAGGTTAGQLVDAINGDSLVRSQLRASLDTVGQANDGTGVLEVGLFEGVMDGGEETGAYFLTRMEGTVGLPGFINEGIYEFSVVGDVVSMTVQARTGLTIGAENPILLFVSDGSLEISGEGLAGRLRLELLTDALEDGFDSLGLGFGEGNFYQLSVNTMDRAVEFIGSVPVNLEAGPYFRVDVRGGLTFSPGGEDLFRMAGIYSLSLDDNGLAIAVEADFFLAAPSLDEPQVVLELRVAGAFFLGLDGMAMELSATADFDMFDALGLRFTTQSSFLVQVNTTNQMIEEINGVAVGLEAGIYTRVQVEGGLVFAPTGDEFFRIEGIVFLETSRDGLVIFGSADLVLVKPGTDEAFLRFGAGLYLIQTIEGVVGQASVSIDADPFASVPSVDFAFGGSFLVTVNTTRQAVTLTAPEGRLLPGGLSEIALPDSPGGSPALGGLGEDGARRYALFEGTGSIRAFGFEWDSSFAFEIQLDGVLFYLQELELVIPSPAGGDPLLTFESGGAIFVGFEGVAGRLKLELKTGIPASIPLEISGDFELHINTFGRDLSLELPVFVERPAWLPETFFISGASSGFAHIQLNIEGPGTEGSGRILQIDPTTGLVVANTAISLGTLDAAIDMTQLEVVFVDDGGRGLESAAYDASLNRLTVRLAAGEGGSTAADVVAAINLGDVFSASLDSLDSPGNDGSGNFRATSEGGFYGRLFIEGRLFVFGFEIDGSFRADVSENFFAVGGSGMLSLTIPFTEITLFRQEVVGALMINEDGVAAKYAGTQRIGVVDEPTEFIPGFKLGRENSFAFEVNTTGAAVESIAGLRVDLTAPSGTAAAGIIAPGGQNDRILVQTNSATATLNGFSIEFVGGGVAGAETVAVDFDLRLITVLVDVGPNGSTANQVVAALNANSDFAGSFTAELDQLFTPNSGEGSISASVYDGIVTGGADGGDYGRYRSEGTLELPGFSSEGIFDFFVVGDSVGVTVDAEFALGFDSNDPLLQMQGSGAFEVNDDGVAAKILLRAGTNPTFDAGLRALGLEFSEDAVFLLEINTRGEAVEAIGDQQVGLEAGEYTRLVITGGMSFAPAGIGLFEFAGTFVFQAEGESLLLYTKADLYVGGTSATDALLEFSAEGFFVLFADGIAADIRLAASAPFLSAVDVVADATFFLQTNTTGRDILLPLPQFAQDLGAAAVLDLPAGLGLVDPAPAPYAIIEVSGTLSVAGFGITGAFGLVLEGETVLAVGENISVTLAAGPTGIRLESAGFGLVVDSESFIFELRGEAFFMGIEGFTGVSADSVLVQFNLSDQVIEKNRILSTGSFGYEFIEGVAAQTVAFSVAGFRADLFSVVSLTGSVGFRVEGASLIAVADNASATLGTSAIGVGVQNSSFGLSIDADGIALEAEGTVFLNGAGFSDASADLVTLRFNQTGRSFTGQELEVGEVAYTFRDLPASTGLLAVSIQGLDVLLLGALYMRGNFGFGVDIDNDTMDIVATEVAAGMSVGPFRAGISGGSLGMRVNSLGKIALEASGTLDVTLPAAVTLAAERVSLRMNTTGEVYTGISLQAGTVTYTFDDLAAANDLIELSVQDAILDLAGFIRIEGGFVFERIDTEVTLSDKTTVTTEALLLGVENFSAFVGVGGGTDLPVGFVLQGLDLAFALFVDSANDGRFWISAQAVARQVGFMGVPNLAVAADEVVVNLNLASDNLVVDYSEGATDLSVRIGPDASQSLTMEGAEGELLEVRGELAIDLLGFFQVSGTFALKKSDQTVTLGDGSEVAVEALTLGAAGVSAFIGLNGGTTGALGLAATDVDFVLALLSEKVEADEIGRSWTSVQATVGRAGLVGVPGVTLSGENLSLRINQASTVDGSLVDYAAAPLEILTGPTTSLDLDLAASEGELLEIVGELAIDLLGFFQVSGTFALKKSDQTVTLGDGSEVAVEALTLGAAGVSAFIGLNGGTAGALGLAATDVDFGLALLSEKVEADEVGRSWTSVQATVGRGGLVGVPGVTLAGENLSLRINQASTVDGSLVDYAAAPLEILTGPATSLDLDLAASEGELLEIVGELAIDLLGFFQVSGTFALKKSDQTVTLGDGSEVAVEALTLGAAGVSAFIGLNGGTPGALGLAATDVDFVLALLSEKVEADEIGRSWTSVQATVGRAGLVGVPGVTLAGENLSLRINQASTVDGSLVDYADAPLEILTGPATSLDLDLAASEGDLLEVRGELAIDLLGFFQVSGTFALKKSDQTVTLGDGSEVAVEALTLGAAGVSAFIGLNGGTAGALGLAATDVDFALALLSEKVEAEEVGRSWTSLQATVGRAGLVGVPGVTLSGENLSLRINQASTVDGSLVDYAAAPLEILTGPATSLDLDLAASEGELLEIVGELAIDLLGFFQVSGTFALKKSDQTVTLGDGSEVAVEALTLGAAGVSAFIGLNGGTPGALGLAATDVDFVLALLSEKVEADEIGRSWTSVQATVGRAGLVGVPGVTLAGENLSLRINQASTVDGSLVDYADAPLEILTGPATSLDLDLAASEGDLLEVRGELAIDLLGFFQVSGTFALKKSDQTVTLGDGSEVAVEALTLGAAGVSAFIGLNGGTAGALGLAATDVDFALALLSEKVEAEEVGRSWTSLQATVGRAGLVGVPGVTLSGENLSLRINQASTVDGSLVDYAAAPLEILTGPATSLDLDLAASEGELLEIVGELAIDLLGFFQVSGTFALKKSDQTVTLGDGSEVAVEALILGAAGVSAFIGLNGGTAGALGLAATDVDFVLALLSEKVEAEEVGRSWTSVQATVGRAGLVGVPGVTLSGENLSLRINQASTADGSLVDYAAAPLEILTGPATSLDLDLAASEGDLLEVRGELAIDLLGFFQVSGTFALKKSDQTVTLGDGSEVAVEALTLGAAGVSAFIGLNGGTAGALGLAATDVDFVLALLSEKVEAEEVGRSWTSVQATVGRAGLVGVPGVTLSGGEPLAADQPSFNRRRFAGRLRGRAAGNFDRSGDQPRPGPSGLGR
jgi:hypothetical protein